MATDEVEIGVSGAENLAVAHVERRISAGSRPISWQAASSRAIWSAISASTPAVAAPGIAANVSHWSAYRAAMRSILGRWAAIRMGIRGRWTGRGSKCASSSW